MTSSLGAVVEGLEPIGLEALEAVAALLDRVDRKYVVPVEAVAAAVAALEGTHLALEIAGRRRFSYRSTYFDTDGLATFRAHVQQRRRRFKVRAREYVDSGLCSFEVKLKGLRGRTVKHRMAYDPELVDRIAAPAGSFLAECLQREYGHPPPPGLAPVLRMRFERVTLVAPDRGERVTIDSGLVFEGTDGSIGRMDPGVAIVESKSSGRAAGIDRLLLAAGIRPEPACSKYCLGIGTLRPEVGASAFKPLLRRHFVSTAPE